MNLEFLYCFTPNPEKVVPLSVLMFCVNRSLGSTSGPHWSHGNLLVVVNGNWIRPVIGDTEKNPRCCITNELSTEVFPLLWEAATGNCCYLSVEILKKKKKNGCQMSKLPVPQRVLVTQKIPNSLNKKRTSASERVTYLGFYWGVETLENSRSCC